MSHCASLCPSAHHEPSRLGERLAAESVSRLRPSTLSSASGQNAARSTSRNAPGEHAHAHTVPTPVPPQGREDVICRLLRFLPGPFLAHAAGACEKCESHGEAVARTRGEWRQAVSDTRRGENASPAEGGTSRSRR